MSRYRRRLKPTQRDLFTVVFWLLLAHLLQLTAATSIDLTTEYAVASKTTATVTSRNIRIKHLTPPPPTAATTKSARGAGHSAAAGATVTGGSGAGRDPPQQMLVALSSKSYISAPTISSSSTTTTTTTPAPAPALALAPVSAPATPAKLAKRAGTPAELKQKKIIKENLNRTRDSEGRSKLQHEAPDHIPDSSGHIPYRIGRPHLTPPEYASDSTGSGTGSGAGYHTVPYEAEKWHSEYWEHDYNKQFGYNNTRVQHIEAECQDDYMKIRIGFNGTFSGLLYSAGYAYDPDCMYINGSGRDYYEFYIQLNRCGTLGKNALHDEKRKNPTNFMWNTVTVQYNPLIEEEYDEHFKVTCEYGYDFWKTVTFPFLDVEVATGNPVVFTLSPPECYMEIQNGYGIGGPRVTGPVRVGDPLTLIIYMRSKYDGFDIVVNDCYAHNGANKRIQLIDEYGCPVDDKLISRFRGSWSDSGVFETQVYAYMKTFRFTGSPALYIECDVRMCHGRCPSQPCHWRNLKAVTKRDISNATAARAATTAAPDGLVAPPLGEVITSGTEKQPTSLSENVNLFQSLRVLQEGESEGDDVYSHAQRLEPGAHQTCLKTSTFSALMATFSVALCLLSGALMIACSRLKHRSKEGSLYDTYITHKGQID